MPQHLQYQVLEFARKLLKTQVRDISGTQLLPFAGSISPEDLQIIGETIKQDCEQIDINEW
ncbi:MAG: hypothetical protein F6K23_12150 [Okeania sp. SIO2C9]|uniref:hypothetical protein n=1 Tax=Okeania sp. SIO2C9 TaxID=2607791 RepID=UPI0013C0D812|nr:hypothetical protein [Okeania sp. SIO2C9]NEQ73733.1 hypothetical protein [Okeania sp. SIO2C9]